MSILVRCPYYRCHKDKRPCLTCEAGGLRFPSFRMRGEFMHEFCTDMDGYHRCSLSRMLTRHYEAEEKEKVSLKPDIFA